MGAEFGIRHTVLDKKKLTWPQVAFLGGHTDDDAMFRLTSQLSEYGIGVSIMTLTNSGARDIAGYEPEKLVDVRWDEADASGRVTGVTQVWRLESPDGSLPNFVKEGILFAADILDEIDPIAVVTPHSGDKHGDHRATNYIGSAIAGRKRPRYTTDTISGYDRSRNKLWPHLYVPLSLELANREIRGYLANESQVSNLPPVEMREVERVITMTARRGKEINVAHAAVLFDVRNAQSSPLREILKPVTVYHSKIVARR